MRHIVESAITARGSYEPDPQRSLLADDTAHDDLLRKQEYLALRARLNFAPNPWPSAAILLFDVLLLAAVASLLRSNNLPAYVLAQLLLPVVFFNAFSILHDCGHGNASSSPFLNALLGHLASGFCFIPYFSWKYIHKQHHAWAGNQDRDPVLQSLRRWRQHGVPWLVRASWNSWVPLGALLQHVVYWTYPLQMQRAQELSAGRALRCLISSAWIPTSYVLLHALAPDIVRPVNVLPAIALFLAAEELVNLPHHVGAATYTGRLAVWEQYLSTRSCYYPRGVSELLVLNFNFHIEHHLFPTLPWFRLRGARDSVKALLGQRYQEAVGIQWNRAARRRDIQAIVVETPICVLERDVARGSSHHAL